MGAFGPKRVVTADDTHSPAAPYKLIDNDDQRCSMQATSCSSMRRERASAGTGSRGKDKEKAFLRRRWDGRPSQPSSPKFLSKYGRWNSPKYLFGESYGTPRSAVVVNDLETQHDTDFNGVILLSQILNFDLGRRAGI
jgi:hypothetical protein